MRISLQLALAFAIGVVLLWALQECDPFSYMANDGIPILKGTVER